MEGVGVIWDNDNRDGRVDDNSDNLFLIPFNREEDYFEDCLSLDDADPLFQDQIQERGEFDDVFSDEESLATTEALLETIMQTGIEEVNQTSFHSNSSEELSQGVQEHFFEQGKMNVPTGTYIETEKKTTIRTVSQDLSQENLITEELFKDTFEETSIPTRIYTETSTQQSIPMPVPPTSVVDSPRGRPVFTPMEELPEQASLSPEIHGISIPPVVAVTQETTMVAQKSSEDDDIDPTGAPKFTTLDQMVESANLSGPELQDIFSDLHGITENMANLQIQPPRPAVFSRLEDELSKLPADRTAAYRRAVLECPGLVSDERKMAFLERENGDPALAAVRLALHWETRLEVFGPDRCFLPMTLGGAMRDEVVNMVRWPIHQLLPVKDTAGRQIWYFDISLRDFEHYSWVQERMALWYLIAEVIMEDPAVVKNGIVILANWKNVEKKHYRDPNQKEEKGKPFRPYAAWIMDTLERAMPIHLRALHFCHPNWFFYHLLPVFLYFSGKYIRTRLQLHRGSDAEILQKLKGFCLSGECVPKELGGKLVLDMIKFMAHRMALEGSRPDPRLVLDQKPISAPSGPSAKRIRSQNTSILEPREFATTGFQNPPANFLAHRMSLEASQPNQPLVLDPKPISVPSGPSVKRVRSENASTIERKEDATTNREKSPVKKGRPSDPRMTRAVEARLANSKLPPREALERGGFTFNLQDKNGEPIDSDKITLTQRKNQLSRRIREAKKDQERLLRQQQAPLGAASAHQHFFPG